MAPYKLNSTYSLAAENIINYALLKGLTEGKVQFLEEDLFKPVHTVRWMKTSEGEHIFDTGSAWAEEHPGGAWRCDDGAAYLSFLNDIDCGFDYEVNDFYLSEKGKRYVAESASRFALENKGSAQELAKAIGTDLESILHTALGFIVSKDPYKSSRNE